jgi:signal transduction histidine kinase
VLRSLRSWVELLLLASAAAALGVAAEWSLYGSASASRWVPDLLTGVSLMTLGLVARSLRPSSRCGLLLAATGLAWFVPNFTPHLLYLHRGPLAQLVLSYPAGRPRRRWEPWLLAAAYAAAVVTPLWGSPYATFALAAALLAAAAFSHHSSAGLERRERFYALQATAFLAVVLGATAAAHLIWRTSSAQAASLHVYEAALCLLAFALLAGLLRAPWAHAEVTDLVVELGETRATTLRNALARALGDPSLQVGHWVPESGRFLDEEGRPLALPEAGSGRAKTIVERDGEPLAVLVHDRAVLDDPVLVEAVSAATRLAAANARLQADLRARLADLAASRRRILAARDDERRRLERRLRDGAERRLDELAATLRDARACSNGLEATVRVGESERQLARVREELRRFARGIHPRELAQHGLARALAALANDFPLPVRLAVDPLGASPAVETCIYFVCSEALANVAKYASAASVTIAVTSNAESITLHIEDDGAGGANPARGTGLRGLTDRVATLGGRLSVDSPPGCGTRLTVVLPVSA